MTSHALERIAERLSGADPQEVMTLIRGALESSDLPHVVDDVTGVSVYEFKYRDGRTIFPVIGEGMVVVTVLLPGMTVTTPTGQIFLTATPLGTGIHQIPDAEYHADPAGLSLSSTLARLLLTQSPLHAWTAHPRLNPNWEPVEKATFDVGRAAHRAVLGVGSAYVAFPSDILASNGAASTKAAKEWAEEQREAGNIPLKADVVDMIGAMEAKVRDRLSDMGIVFDRDRSELTALAEIDRTMCRAMIDNAPSDPSAPLYDFKTTTDASPEGCQRAIINYGYDVQASHYLETWKAATGEDRKFRFVFCEKTPPHEVCVIELGQDSLFMARKKTIRAREIWRQCVESDHWPGYPAGVHQIELPAWFEERWMERESVEKHFRQTHGHDILDQARRWQAPHTTAAE